MKNKQSMANEKSIVYQRTQMFVCAKKVETKTIVEKSPKCLKRGPACFDKMDSSLQLLRKEMVSFIDLQKLFTIVCSFESPSDPQRWDSLIQVKSTI